MNAHDLLIAAGFDHFRYEAGHPDYYGTIDLYVDGETAWFIDSASSKVILIMRRDHKIEAEIADMLAE